MFINEMEARKLLKPLYNTAEKDRNDVIANGASALAVRLETVKSKYFLSSIDLRIIQYAKDNMPLEEAAPKHKRKTYKRRVSLS